MLEGRYEVASKSWEQAFVACAQGRFGDAVAIGISCLPQVPINEAARLRLTMGSSLRQMRRYDAAAALDRDDESFPAAARVHLAISRAADHVGAANSAAASETLRPSFEDLLDAFGAQDHPIDVERARIRHAWVATEIALLLGQPSQALEVIDPLFQTLHERERVSASWPRHVAKTALFRGVVLADLGRYEDAKGDLRMAVEMASPLGAVPVVQVATQVLDSIAT